MVSKPPCDQIERDFNDELERMQTGFEAELDEHADGVREKIGKMQAGFATRLEAMQKDFVVKLEIEHLKIRATKMHFEALRLILMQYEVLLNGPPAGRPLSYRSGRGGGTDGRIGVGYWRRPRRVRIELSIWT